MATLPDPVRVQLLTDWWQDPAVWALGLSVASIVLTLLFRFWDRVKVKLFVFWPVFLSPAEREIKLPGRALTVNLERIRVTVTNKSRTVSTTLFDIQPQMRLSTRWADGTWLRPVVLPISAGITQESKRLEPGDSHRVDVDLSEMEHDVRSVLNAFVHARTAHIRFAVTSGHGRKTSRWVPTSRVLREAAAKRL